MNGISNKWVFMWAIAFLLMLLFASCNFKPPENVHLVYEVSKALSSNCGHNILCIDFEGIGYFGNDTSSCKPITFVFDARSKMHLDIETQPIYPPTQVNVHVTETDPRSQNIQGPWDLTLKSPTPNGLWGFDFKINASPPDLELTSGVAIAGHYTVSILDAQQAASGTITIHAEADAPPGTGTTFCSAN
jgi:hypothetical protein